MWTQDIDPLGDIALSASTALVLIVVFLVCLVGLRLSGILASVIALAAQLLVAFTVFRMPLSAASGSALLGLLTSLWPIAYIIVMAVWLYRSAVASGRFDVVRASIRSVSPDSRIQVLLISFAFGAFLEGGARFRCADRDTDPVPPGDHPRRSAWTARDMAHHARRHARLQPRPGISAVVPRAGARRSRLRAPHHGRDLRPVPDLEATARVPRGRRGLRRGSLPFRAGGDRSLEPVLHPDRVHPRVLVAPVKELFTTGVLSFTTLAVPIPGLFGSVTSASGDVVTATWTFSALGATGTAILLAVRVSFLTSPQLSARRLLRELGATIGELWKAIALISIILVLANIANYAAATSSMGSALAATGALFPLIAPVIGWIGVFLTGSVVNYNTLFAPLQVATAEGIGSDPALFVGANTAGGNAAKVISPQSIAIAAGAVGLSGRESDILRASILYSLGILAVICVWNLVLSLVLT